MAAAHMQQRPYPTPVYHTPQSNSPASVASSQGHDQHARLYTQPPPQMQQSMYGYPPFQVPPNTYPQHTAQHPQQMMNPQPLVPHPSSQAPMPHQSSAHAAGMTNSPRPHPKLESGIPRPMDPTALQRSPPGPMNANHSTSSGPSHSGSGLQTSQSGGQGVNPNAAPGPIPATTPLVVRQDGNGVQWIAFEYSRDRVKMEYTIRCDVESINTDSLPTDFRTENCVYPRACCGKDNYKGNRLQYENECNTVGWALAQLNACLRGKRGLIQRAVDSWRNSNQDQRLRSRRVRRMAKLNTRKTVGTSHSSSSHMAGPRDIGLPPPGTNALTPSIPQRPPPNISIAGSAHLHHHHAHADGSQTGADDVSVTGDLDQRQRLSKPSPAPIRPSNVFQGLPAYPTPPNPYGSSMLPHLHTGIDGPPAHSTVSVSMALPTKTEDPSPSPEIKPEHASLFGKLPDGKQRKFFTVEDPDRSNHKVRVKMALHECPIEQVPDSYRRTNSVYPRSWYPVQMQLSPSSRGSRGRFLESRDETSAASATTEEDATNPDLYTPTIQIQVPLSSDHEASLPVPGLSRKARRKEEQINEMGYRISWGASRTFANRIMFLQHSIDVYRSKVRDGVVAGGKEVETVAPVYETRVGKRRWVERRVRVGRGKGGRGGGG